MHFNLKRVSAIVLSTALVYSGSALAAYGPAPAPVVHKPGNWTLSAGYGQTFGHKKVSDGAGGQDQVEWNRTDQVGEKNIHPADTSAKFALGDKNSDGFSQVWEDTGTGEDLNWVEVDAYNPNAEQQGPTMWHLLNRQGYYTRYTDGSYSPIWTPNDEGLFADWDPRTTYSILHGGDPATYELEDLKIFEVDLFHSSGFGVVYMGTAQDGKFMVDDALYSKYSFTGIFGAYKMAFGRDMSVRLGVGQTDQEYKGVGVKLDGKMAWNVEGKWNMPLGKSLNVFLAGGWLNQKEADFGTFKYDPSAGYWKVGVSFTM